MARSKSFILLHSEYYAVRALTGLLERLPFSWAEALAGATLRIILLFIPKRRALMRESIARSFPALRSRDIENIVQKSLDNLAKGAAVFVRMPRILQKEEASWITIEGISHLEDALQAGKGVLAPSAHYGCWELMASWTMKHYKAAGVYRPLDNRRLEPYVKAIRCSAGGALMDRRDVLRQAMRWMKQNGVWGILIDQNFAAEGGYVDFLGKSASTTPLVSILARRTGAAVVPVHNHWDGRRLRIIWEEPMSLSRNPDVKLAIQEDTQKMTGYVGKWIRDDPGQWLWLHNRWKRQPT